MDYLRETEEHFDAMRKSMNGLMRWAHEQRVERLDAEARVEWLVDLLAEASVLGDQRVTGVIASEVAKMHDSVRARFVSSAKSCGEKHR